MSTNWDLIGHEWAVDLLRRHVASGGTRHAYLITGPDGVGRRTLALRFAMALNCTDPPAPGEFCGECRDCKQIAKMLHPDLTIVEMQEGHRKLRVGQVREVLLAVSMKPYQSSHRVVLFRHFEDANPSAYNALLKMLEEAPGYVVCLLTANIAEQLPSTIVSRCEVLRLHSLPLEKVQKMLEAEEVEKENAHLLAHISGGRPGYARRLVKDEEYRTTRAQRLMELQSLLKNSRVQKFAYVENLTKPKAKPRDIVPGSEEDEGVQEAMEVKSGNWNEMRQTLPIWLSFWRDVLIKTSGASVPITNIDFEEQIDELAARLDLPVARRIVADMELGIKRLERNVNLRLLTEVLLLDWPRP